MDLSAHGCKECGQRPLFPTTASQAVDLPCNNCLAEIRTALLARIDEIDTVAHQLYIGRSNYPERRLFQHFSAPPSIRKGEDWAIEVAPNRLSVLHWSASWQEIASLEEAVIADLKQRGKRKLLNTAAESWGDFDGAWNCLYVLWAGKRTVKVARLPPAEAIDHLQWAIVQPEREQWRREPRHLVVGSAVASPAATQSEVFALSDRRTRFLQSHRELRVRSAGRKRGRSQELPWQS